MKQKFYYSWLIAATLTAVAGQPLSAQNTPFSQMEKLDRGAIAIKNGSNLYVSWRLLGTDDEDRTTFDVLKNGNQTKKNLYATNVSVTATTSDKIQIVTKVDGVPTDTTDVTRVWDSNNQQLQLDRPAKGASGGTYTPNDCSVGDVDGDGIYELFVKWDPSNSQDNSKTGITDNVIIDCYRLDGTKLWRIDLGKNIRAGAHYTQYLVYDFDGDGKAELICKTAPGSVDGQGKYVNEAATDATIKGHSNTKVHRGSDGLIKQGPEYLTVFNGETGAAIHTVWYNPNRAGSTNKEATYPSDKSFWGDNYANRSERYLATVAYLDGADHRPSAVMCRGYYTRAYLWAVDFDGEQLSTKWLHQSTSTSRYSLTDAEGKTESIAAPAATGRSSGSKTAYGNGNHNISVADVDGDGNDEIIWGSCAINNDGRLLYATGFGHGDAIHVSDFVLDNPGLEVFEVHEESPYGWDLHDAATGKILLSATSGADNGRGVCADVDSESEGGEFWSAAKDGVFNASTGQVISTNIPATNFRVYWDGDLYEELFDGRYSTSNSGCTPTIYKWNSSDKKTNELKRLTEHDARTCNYTKATPCLQADLLGDWREEIIMWDGADPSKITIFTTTTASSFRVPTLMHDHVYRLGVAWQNVAYNQPPHLGYPLAEALRPHLVNPEKTITVAVGDSVHYNSYTRYTKSNLFYCSIAPDGTRYSYNMMDGFEKGTVAIRSIGFKGCPTQEGDYKFVFRMTGLNGEQKYDTITVKAVADLTAIDAVSTGSQTAKSRLVGQQLQLGETLGEQVNVTLYDLSGRTLYSQTIDARQQKSITLPIRSGNAYLIQVESKGEKEVLKVQGE